MITYFNLCKLLAQRSDLEPLKGLDREQFPGENWSENTLLGCGSEEDWNAGGRLHNNQLFVLKPRIIYLHEGWIEESKESWWKTNGACFAAAGYPCKRKRSAFREKVCFALKQLSYTQTVAKPTSKTVKGS